MTDETGNTWASIIKKCWEDEAFKKRLIGDPAATLAAEGVPLPDGVSVTVVEDTASVRHLVLPAPGGALADADMEYVAGGALGCREWDIS
jgi:hypothetical protein